jgi:hypothetical protein
LIEEYGYQSIDYIYYKRSDSSVEIQLDTVVMDMLKDNESKKEITLFVTSQRIVIIEPHSNKGPTKSAPKKTKGSMMKLQFPLLCLFQHPSKIYTVLSYVNF